MKNRLRSLVVFDDGRTNGLVVFDDRWWSSMIVGGLEVSGVEVEEVSGGEVETSREGVLFFSYFKELVGREVTVELKNDLAIRGTLHSVDQYLNIKLENTRVVDQEKYPHMVSIICLKF
ncbi:unnamed protein product [Prunus armeniaca]